MGIGILEVMLLHYFTLNNAPSGFGLFYSFTKDSNIKRFYKKRFANVLIPYLIIAIPYYTYFFVTNRQDLVPVYSKSLEPISSLVTYLGRITTIGYWHEGNFNGMWYLSLTILLYLMYPAVHQLFRSLVGGGKKLSFMVDNYCFS